LKNHQDFGSKRIKTPQHATIQLFLNRVHPATAKNAASLAVPMLVHAADVCLPSPVTGQIE